MVARRRIAAVLRSVVLVGLVALPTPVAGASPSDESGFPPLAAAGAQILQAASRQPAASSPAPSAATFVSEEPCPNDSIFTCITLRVPRDHFSASPETFDVVFALHRATGNRKGVFVTVNGGPGLAGVALADSYEPYFDRRLVRRYDLVFFDKRGVGMSEELQCPDASLAFYSSPHVPTVSGAEARAYSDDSATFATDCIAETGVDPADLPYFSTDQAVEDLEAFREWLGAEQMDVYGESYGTQFAQAYGAAHPDRTHSIILDGAVDLTMSVFEYYAEGARAYEHALVGTLNTCSRTRACRRDLVGTDALKVYDRLAARLTAGPVGYDYVRKDGSIERRQFGLGDLETAAAGYVGGEFDRMQLERAMAWASRGVYLPLAKLAYIGLGQDAETLEAIIDPSWSDAMYYATECLDYRFGSGTAEERAQTYLRRGRQADVADVRLGSIFYGDLPCPHWPVHGTASRPDYLTDTPFPIFILASTWDPATAYPNSLRIFEHADDAYLVTQPGGGHVIFGYGVPCVDGPIYQFLFKDQRPTKRKLWCTFTGVDPYVRIPAHRRGDYAGPLAAMTAIDREINGSTDFLNWSGEGRLRYGCLFGGWIRYRPNVVGYRITLHDCRFTRGLPLTGTASINDERGTFKLDVTGPAGLDLVYRRDADGNRSVTGTYAGG